MNKTFLKLLTATALFVGASSNANAICLDYWIKGPAACKDQAEEKKLVIKGGNVNLNIEKDEARIAYEKELNIQIDKFLADYGKPPREFVAFHIDPSLENAIRWVKKFNEQRERSRKIAVSWRQADKLFQEYSNTGQLSLPPESGVTASQVEYLLKALEENPSELREVKGYGVDIKGEWDKTVLDKKYSKLNYKDEAYAKAVDKLTQTGSSSAYSLEKLENKYKKADKEKSAKIEPLEISYYFSAKCPFCQKFKPELKDAIAKFGKKNIKLTCVDMTPGEKKPDNLTGGLDCKWRPLLAGEAKQFGIKRTPSLLVKRGGASGLELLENYHDTKTLVKYFKYGAN